MTIGERIEKARVKKGWSQRELATISGASNASISRWESNRREITSGNIMQLCIALDVTPNWLLTGDENYIPLYKRVEELKICYELIGRYDDLEKRVKALEDWRNK